MPVRFKVSLYLVLLIAFACYSGFIYLRLPVAHVRLSAQALHGKELWQQKNCTACHQLYGLGGFLGPDLTNIYSAPGKGPVYIKAFIKGGTITMPSFNLDEQELDAIVAFLQHADETGKSGPKAFNRNMNGTIESR